MNQDPILNSQPGRAGGNKRIVEMIQSFRSSHSTIRMAHIINVALTFLFGYRFMSAIFNLFGELTESALIFAGVSAGLALIALFDLPYHAWNAIAQEEGLTTEQMATADTAAKFSLWGSLASSVAAIVLSQDLMELPGSVTFIATGIGLLAVAWIAIKHMQWWHEFQKESFQARQRAQVATHTATKLDNQIAQENELADLEAAREKMEHKLRVEGIKAEQELEYQKLLAEAEIKKAFLEQKLAQKKAVSQQVAAKWKAKANQVSDAIVDKEADALVDELLTDYGLPVATKSPDLNGKANTGPKLN